MNDGEPDYEWDAGFEAGYRTAMEEKDMSPALRALVEAASQMCDLWFNMHTSESLIEPMLDLQAALAPLRTVATHGRGGGEVSHGQLMESAWRSGYKDGLRKAADLCEKRADEIAISRPEAAASLRARAAEMILIAEEVKDSYAE